MDIPIDDNPDYAPLEVASQTHAQAPGETYICCSHAGYTVWPEILPGNLFWQIGSFASNPPIFHPPKLYSVLSSIFAIIASTCTIGLQLGAPV